MIALCTLLPTRNGAPRLARVWSDRLAQPNAYAAVRNLVIGATRHVGFANIACARRYYARDDQRILALYGYT
jgi:hypothetical protein